MAFNKEQKEIWKKWLNERPENVKAVAERTERLCRHIFPIGKYAI